MSPTSWLMNASAPYGVRIFFFLYIFWPLSPNTPFHDLKPRKCVHHVQFMRPTNGMTPCSLWHRHWHLRKIDLTRCVLPNIHVHVLHASTRMDVTLHNTNIATLYAFIKRRHNMTSSYDWPCSLQIYSIQMPHARCRIRANIRIFCRQPRQ